MYANSEKINHQQVSKFIKFLTQKYNHNDSGE